MGRAAQLLRNTGLTQLNMMLCSKTLHQLHERGGEVLQLNWKHNVTSSTLTMR
jgi:hypothetical protein